MKKKSLMSLFAGLFLTGALLSGCSSNSSSSALAQKEKEYPTKQVEVTVPFAAGGGTDIFARAMGDYLTKEWGQTVTIVNKPGAAGATGTQEVLKNGKKDGYTVLAHTVSSTSALLSGNMSLPFGYEDFQFVSAITGDPLAYVVKADAPWNNMKDFSEWVLKNPEELSFASNGPTAIATFGVIEWLDKIGGDYSKARLITTNGTGDALPKVAGGHIVLAVQDLGAVSNLVKAGKLKILGIASQERSPYFPDVQTLEEQGIKGMTTKFWGGVSMPAGTPDHVVKIWEETLAKMMNDPEFLNKLESMNTTPKYMNSEEFSQSVRQELDNFSKIVEEKGLIK